jgi:peptidoglycan/LPS O-acetylase OafA/YrhL
MTAIRPARRAPRWGLRTLGFLLLSAVAVLTAGLQGQHTAGTLGCLLLGLGGAAVCSARGLRGWQTTWADRRR